MRENSALLPVVLPGDTKKRERMMAERSQDPQSDAEKPNAGRRGLLLRLGLLAAAVYAAPMVLAIGGEAQAQPRRRSWSNDRKRGRRRGKSWSDDRRRGRRSRQQRSWSDDRGRSRRQR